VAPVTLAAGAALMLATAALFAYVGRLMFHRPTRPESHGAMLSFGVWWLAGAAVLALASSHTLLALAGVRDAGPHAVINYLVGSQLALALASLVYYLLFLYTGRRAVRVPVAIAYAGYFAFLMWYFTLYGPGTIVDGTWAVRSLPANPPPPSVATLFGLALALPALGSVLAYASLLLRLRERTPRYRVAMVSAGVLVLFVSLLVAFVAGWQGSDFFPLTYELPGLVAGVMVLWAFRPPRWVQHRFGIESVEAGP
jgi:hypothetical protein